MFADQFKSFIGNLKLSMVLIADSDAGGSKPEIEQVQEKIAASKNRRIPVVKFLLLFAVIIITVVVLEYFI
jgi:hypothetical protein